MLFIFNIIKTINYNYNYYFMMITIDTIIIKELVKLLCS